MMRRARLKSNMVALFVEHGANYALPLITLPYLLHVLGPGNFGRVAFAQAFIAYFAVLADYGFNLSATKRVAQIRDDPRRLSRLVLSIFIVKTAMMITGFLIMLTVVWAVPSWRANMMLYVVSFLAVLGGVIFPVWLFQGLERMRQAVFLSLSARVVTVAAIFLFVKQPEDYQLVAGIQASAGVVAGVGALFVFPTLVTEVWQVPGWADIRETITDGWHLFVSNVATNLYTSSNVFILGLLTAPAVVGQFAAAEKLVKAVTSLLSPVSQAFYPYVARTAALSSNDALEINRRLLRLQGAFTFALSILLLLFAKPIVLIVFGDLFKPAIALVQVMAFLPFLIGVSNVLGIQTMLNFGLTRVFSRVLILLGIVNLILLFVLVPRWDALGAAVSVVFSEFVVTAAMGFVLSRAGLLSRLLHPSSGRRG